MHIYRENHKVPLTTTLHIQFIYKQQIMEKMEVSEHILPKKMDIIHD